MHLHRLIDLWAEVVDPHLGLRARVFVLCAWEEAMESVSSGRAGTVCHEIVVVVVEEDTTGSTGRRGRSIHGLP